MFIRAVPAPADSLINQCMPMLSSRLESYCSFKMIKMPQCGINGNSFSAYFLQMGKNCIADANPEQ